MTIQIDFGRNLRIYREKQGLTQRQLADRIGYTEKSISKWEHGSGLPPMEVAVHLARMFDVSVDEMVLAKTTERYFLGIDGGGTKTEFKLEDESGKTLRLVRKGPSNPNDIGIEQTQRLLDEGVREACCDLPYGSISMYAGISGGGLTGNYAQMLHRFFEKYGFLTFDNGSDIENLAALADCDPCVLVIMGTGFIVFALNGEKRHRIAGWGQLFDEGGSGYTLGRDAVCAALRAADGSGPETLISELLMQRFGETAEAHVAALYRGGKKYIADLSAVVFRAAESGDAVAQGILDKNMAYAAAMIDAALGKITSDSPVKVLFSGGISARHADLFKRIQRHIKDQRGQLVYLDQAPVDGAVCLARRLYEKENTKSANE